MKPYILAAVLVASAVVTPPAHAAFYTLTAWGTVTDASGSENTFGNASVLVGQPYVMALILNSENMTFNSGLMYDGRLQSAEFSKLDVFLQIGQLSKQYSITARVTLNISAGVYYNVFQEILVNSAFHPDPYNYTSVFQMFRFRDQPLTSGSIDENFRIENINNALMSHSNFIIVKSISHNNAYLDFSVVSSINSLVYTVGDEAVLPTPTNIPEPVSFALFSAGLLGLRLVQRKAATAPSSA